MIIKECRGFELKKDSPASPEDSFNRSEITYVEDGMEKTLSVIYLRYFEEFKSEYLPYEDDPLFVANGREVYFRDIVAFVMRKYHPEGADRKRLYFNNQSDFEACFKQVDIRELQSVFNDIQK